jgi:endonuclease YncB( thermonuclease family)
LAAAKRRQGGELAMAAAIFALGALIGAAARPALLLHGASSADTVLAAAGANETHGRLLDQRLTYPAEVVRVIDGDTFEVHVALWPGLSVDTKVRLRDIDAPELHARCADEHVKAEAARAALTTILAEGDVAISRVGLDKYGGRVDAAASTRNTPDVSAAMRNGGWARSYAGGRRGTWC